MDNESLSETVMNKELEHPYWEHYLQLSSLKRSFRTSDGKKTLRLLALQAGFSYIDWLKLELLLLFPASRFRHVQRLFFCVLREDFAYSVLPPETLELICSLSPLVELGAGNGYLAWLLQQKGADVLAFDAFPVEEGRNWFFHTKFGFPAKGARSWSPVKKGSAEDLTAFPDRTLVLCWPPKNRMALDGLRYFPGNRLILISEKSCCASKEFFKELELNWELAHRSRTGSWLFCHAETVEIYYRKGTDGLTHEINADGTAFSITND